MKSKMAVLGLVGSMLFSCESGEKKPVSLANEKDSVSYSVGVNIAKQLEGQGLDTMNVEAFTEAIADVLSGVELQLSEEEVQEVMQAFGAKMQEKARNEMLSWQEDNKAFLEENKAKEGVITLESGLQYQVLAEGDGEKVPAEDSKVTVHYTGSLIDGKVFDSSVERGQPATFPANGVIRGWVEALQMMKVGDKWKLFVPHELGYGPRGTGSDIKPFSTLIFEVELIGIGDPKEELFEK